MVMRKCGGSQVAVPNKVIIVEKPVRQTVVTERQPTQVETSRTVEKVEVQGTGTIITGNIFISEEQPVMEVPGLWIELRPDGSVKTMWVGTTV